MEAQQGSHRETGTARLLSGEPGVCARLSGSGKVPDPTQASPLWGAEPPQPAPSTEVTLEAQSGRQGHGQGPSQASVADGASSCPGVPHPQLAFQNSFPEPGPRERKHVFATISRCGEKPGTRTCAHVFTPARKGPEHTGAVCLSRATSCTWNSRLSSQPHAWLETLRAYAAALSEHGYYTESGDKASLPTAQEGVRHGGNYPRARAQPPRPGSPPASRSPSCLRAEATRHRSGEGTGRC